MRFSKQTVRQFVEDLSKHKISIKHIAEYMVDVTNQKINVNTLVITSDFALAKKFFDIEYEENKDYVIRYRKSRYGMFIEYENGARITHLTASDNSRGHKGHCAYIDENVDIDFLDMTVRPMFPFGVIEARILQDVLEENGLI